MNLASTSVSYNPLQETDYQISRTASLILLLINLSKIRSRIKDSNLLTMYHSHDAGTRKATFKFTMFFKEFLHKSYLRKILFSESNMLNEKCKEINKYRINKRECILITTFSQGIHLFLDTIQGLENSIKDTIIIFNPKVCKGTQR